MDIIDTHYGRSTEVLQFKECAACGELVNEKKMESVVDHFNMTTASFCLICYERSELMYQVEQIDREAYLVKSISNDEKE